MTMKVEKREHLVWRDFEKYPATLKHIGPLLGKWQYFYSSEKGMISLVELSDYLRTDYTLWEIMSLEGWLFEDVERYESKDEAEKRIRQLLE